MQGLVETKLFFCTLLYSLCSVKLREQLVQAIRPLGVLHGVHVVHGVVGASQEVIQYCLCSRGVQQGLQFKGDVGVQAQGRSYSGGGGEILAGVQASQSLLLFLRGRLGEGECLCDWLLFV